MHLITSDTNSRWESTASPRCLNRVSPASEDARTRPGKDLIRACTPRSTAHPQLAFGEGALFWGHSTLAFALRNANDQNDDALLPAESRSQAARAWT